jgi:hypothetical protein
MWFLSFRQLAVAARLSRSCIPLFRAVFMQVAAPIPQAARRLFAVCPYVAKLLAVVTLGEGVLWFMSLLWWRCGRGWKV